MDDAAVLRRWITHIFDHPVAEPDWYWSEDAPKWPEDCVRVPELIAETFENAGELLAPYTDAQLEQGFWYLIGSATPGDFREKLVDEKIPAVTRLRALRSFVPLFEQVMAVRCTSCLSSLKEQPSNPLNGSCYMWWDLLPFRIWNTHPEPQDPVAPHYGPCFAEIVAAMRGILAIPHDACRESALHGLGHLSRDYPHYRDQFATIIDDFLVVHTGLCSELIAYAERAKTGNVQ